MNTNRGFCGKPLSAPCKIVKIELEDGRVLERDQVSEFFLEVAMQATKSCLYNYDKSDRLEQMEASAWANGKNTAIEKYYTFLGGLTARNIAPIEWDSDKQDMRTLMDDDVENLAKERGFHTYNPVNE